MRRRFEVAVSELLASCVGSIRGLEVDEGSPTADRVRELVWGAGRLLEETAEPRGLFEAVTPEEFAIVHSGDGGNDGATPAEQVAADAEGLALFAATLGSGVSDRICAHFEAGEMAEAYLLDQVASFAADELAKIAAHRFTLASKPSLGAALPYSPGYCGWNVSGQRALFARLDPGEIGITLNESCLMHPIKSVSGVLILAPLEEHDFTPAFPCCATCTTVDCQERVATLKAALAVNGGREP